MTTAWPEVALGQLLEKASVFTDGDWVESKDQDPEGSVRLIQLADIGDGTFVDKSARFLTLQKAEELKCTFLRAGDILVARMPDPLGRACIFPGSKQQCVTVVDVCVIRPPSHEVDPAWLVSAINAPQFRRQIEQFASGTTRSRISRSNLAKLRLQLPPLDEQRRIAAILDKADEVRSKRKAALETLETLSQAIFIEMFGDPVSNPMGWPLVSIGSTVDSIQKWDPDTHPGEQFRYIDLSSIDRESKTIGDTSEVPVSDAPSRAKQLVAAGDVLVSTVRPNLNGVAQIPHDLDGATASSGFTVLRSVANRLDPLFLFEWVKQPAFVDHLVRCATGASYPAVSDKIVKSSLMPFPPLAMQRQFGTESQAISLNVDKEIGQAMRADELFASLQQKAFQGAL